MKVYLGCSQWCENTEQKLCMNKRVPNKKD